MLGKTPRAEYLASKKLSTLPKKRPFTAEAIFFSVIRRQETRALSHQSLIRRNLTEILLKEILPVRIVVCKRSLLKTTACTSQADSVE